MKVVYIAHPLRGDWDANVASARRYCLAALRAGYAPLAPYLMGLALDDAVAEDRATGLGWDLDVIARSVDELWLCGDRISEGMGKEADEARAQGVIVRAVRLVDTVLVWDVPE